MHKSITQAKMISRIQNQSKVFTRFHDLNKFLFSLQNSSMVPLKLTDFILIQT